jgi:uncharacterized protein (DUF58 family)
LVALKNKLALILIIAAIGIWLSAVTLSGVGLAAVPIILILLVDQGVPFVESGAWKFSVSRRVTQPKVVTGERVLVELTVTNEGRDVERMVLEDQLPSGVKVTRGSRYLICALKRGARATLRYEVSLLDPGDVHFGECLVRVQSLFGLTEQRLELVAPSTVRIYPRLLSRKVLTSRAKALSFSGTSPSRFKGGRLEFMNTRRHVYGDPLRDINWKASARLGKTLVNEWHAERGLDCVMIVDLLDQDLPKVGKWSARTDVIACAYELSHALIGSGNRVGLLVLGAAPVKLQPGFGSKHLRVLLDRLVTAQEGSVWSARNVEGFLETFFRKQYRFRGGALFFVTANPGVDVLEAVRSLALKGFSCHTILVNTLEQESVALSELRVAGGASLSLGTRVARAEIEWFESRFEKYSKVYEWTEDSGFVELGGL